MTGRQGRWAWGLVLPAVGLDRWMKALAGSWVEPVPLWPGILALHRVENRGMAFGLLAGRPVLLALLSLLVLGAGCWGLSRCRLGLLTRLGSALLLAGLSAISATG